ncbi:MAG: ECF transporter S component [Candidatus Caccosoma sp.]|nr:ECF transporter S component [Candidatus Caccosoma sp.]
MKKNALNIIMLIISVLIITLSLVFKEHLVSFLTYLLLIIGSLIFVFSVLLLFKRDLNIKQISMIALQSSITIILYFFLKINLPFFPGWLDIQVSEIPAIITSFIYGPYAGALIILIRFIFKLPGSITAGVGEFADLLLGLTLILISGIIYKRNRTLKGAIKGMALGILASTALACLLNYLVLIPAYIYIAGFSKEVLVKSLSYISFVNESNFMLCYIFIGVLPFNIFRYIIVFALTFILYKKTHLLIEKITK